MYILVVKQHSVKLEGVLLSLLAMLHLPTLEGLMPNVPRCSVIIPSLLSISAFGLPWGLVRAVAIAYLVRGESM
jgi:hypothetical protein